MSRQTRSNVEIHDYFNMHGCVLLDDYINAAKKMRYICKCGKESKISWNHFYSGKRCGYCHSTGRKKKYTTGEVKRIFLDRGCELLENEYINNRISMRYICKCGNESNITFSAFLNQNQHCIICAGVSRSGEKNTNWKQDRVKKDRDDLLRRKCLNHIHRAIERVSTSRRNKVISLLKYSPNEMAKFLNIVSFDLTKYSIDHIFPIQAFLDHGIIDISLINSLDNLKIILRTKNCRKGHKYDRAKFLKWLNKKGVNGFQKLGV